MQVATVVQADWLFLLTDVDALHTADPTNDPEALPIREVYDIAQLEVRLAGAALSTLNLAPSFVADLKMMPSGQILPKQAS